MSAAHSANTPHGDLPHAGFLPLSIPRAALGESPVWSAEHQAVWWVDVDGHSLLRTTLDGATESWGTPEIPGFVQCVGGEVVVGMRSGIFRFTPAPVRFERLVELPAEGQRFNDACRDDRGRIWAGTMDLENLRDNGVLYLFDPETQTLTPQLDGFRTINGLAWDQARSRLFVSDSHPSVQTVWTCAASGDRLALRDLFARFDRLDGRPDGAALDGSGRYWIAGVGGGALYRFAPDGTLDHAWATPQIHPTKPALIPGPAPAMVLTSREDDGIGGRLAIWHAPGPDHEG